MVHAFGDIYFMVILREPVNFDTPKPVDIFSCFINKCHIFVGIMCGSGLLENPAMFAGHEFTPLQCVKDWVSFRQFKKIDFFTSHWLVRAFK